MHNYLHVILAQKRAEVTKLKKELENQPNHMILQIDKGESVLHRKIKSFKQILKQARFAIIAEIKRKSPAKGFLAQIINPAELAQEYVMGGATAISVLTDHFGFSGSLTDLLQVSQALVNLPCPVLRKDFIIDPIQIAESIAFGADAILLIVSILKERTQELLIKAQQCGIDALVEVHDYDELEYALSIGADLIGVNNRNLTTFDVNLKHAQQLINHIPNHVISIAESGITDVESGIALADKGYRGLLIGEALVKTVDPKIFIQNILNAYEKSFNAY